MLAPEDELICVLLMFARGSKSDKLGNFSIYLM